jgi:hypothetical protein
VSEREQIARSGGTERGAGDEAFEVVDGFQASSSTA